MTQKNNTPSYYGSWFATPATDVMMIGRTTVWAGSATTVARIPDLALMIDLADILYESLATVKGNGAAQRLFSPEFFSAEVPVITINWPDGSFPGLKREWWELLLQGIEDLPDGAKVGIGCAGGTGRTGTALAIMAGLAGIVMQNDDPVEWVRAIYKADAVETEAQCAYIERITGLKVQALGSDKWKWAQPVGSQPLAKQDNLAPTWRDYLKKYPNG